jgi:hypothetical protein
MAPWNQALRTGTLAGSIASLTSMVALLAAGRREAGTPIAPLNAVSHWIWGDRALWQQRASWRHTVAGYVIHHGASVFWGVLYAKAWAAREGASRRPVPTLAGAGVAAGAACLVDLRLTPHRLTPGFEHQLSRPALGAVYACFALGLAAGAMLAARRR